jgi:hypothetical protein
MNWNDSTYTNIVAKHPVLDGKTESVALAVWALEQNKDMTPQDWRDLSEKTGVQVRGRAVGSARQVLGLPAGKVQKPKRRPGRPKGSKNRVPGRGPGHPRNLASADGALTDLVSTLKNLQRERDDAVRALAKIRELVSGR